MNSFFRKDLLWWSTFLDLFNGTSFIPRTFLWSSPDQVLASDSCLTGCGGHTPSGYFHCPFPSSILEQNLPIHCLELLAVLLSLKLWAHMFVGQRVLINCDNTLAVSALVTGKSKDLFMCSCLRDICLLVCQHNFELSAVHLPGVENRLADSLSRWHLSPHYAQHFHTLTEGVTMAEYSVTDDQFVFMNDW